MCGIYGYIGRPTSYKKVLEIMESLGIESEKRGIHATGYYGLNSHPYSAKAPLKATEFFKTAAWKDLYTIENLNILVGHNRWATNGSPQNNENNHPFTTGRFGFVHNGIVSGVKPDMEISCRSECDSEKIFRYFLKRFYNDHNHFNALEKTMKAFDKDGDYACALVDAKERYLYLFRNMGRPMVWIFVEKLNVMFYCSADYIIKSAFLINGISFESKKVRNLKAGQIMRISEDLKILSHFVDVLKPAPVKTYVYTGINNTIPLKNYYRCYAPKKKVVSNNYECKKCKRQFINSSFAKKHIEETHKIFDLEAIAKLITAPGGGTVSFSTSTPTGEIKTGQLVPKSKSSIWDDFKITG